MPCHQILPSDADLRLGKVIGAGPVAFLTDGPNCPGPAVACRSKFAARPGATVLLGRSRGDYVCAFDGRIGSIGWLPQQRIAVNPIHAAPPLGDWIGTWRLYDNGIVLKQEGEGLDAEGEAYWPSKSIPPANEGAFAGTAKPSGNRCISATRRKAARSTWCWPDRSWSSPTTVNAAVTTCPSPASLPAGAARPSSSSRREFEHSRSRAGLRLHSG
jgi:hypothetical protein